MRSLKPAGLLCVLLLAGQLSDAGVSVSAERVAETIKPASPAKAGLPVHERFSFDDDKISEGVAYRERQLLIIPVGAYRALQRGGDRRMFDARLTALRRVTYMNPSQYARALPVFPPVNERQAFHAAGKSVEFKNGAGIRFITRFGPEGSLTTNDNIFYTFQGLSRDGKTLVCMFYPIKVRNLPISQDDSVAKIFIDEQTPDRFTPNLEELDRVVQSIQLNPTGR